MLLIYWTGKVWSAVASLCDHLTLSYEMRDDRDEAIDLTRYEAIIPSPWVPSHHRIYQSGKVIAELDFAYQFLPRGFQIISVTGTDGKSTTSWILYRILEKEYCVKKSVYLSWNFDIPFSATVLEILQKWETEGIIVVEVSSFMAYAIKKFQSEYSLFTNFRPDHLNWHSDMQDYLDAKMRILQSTKKSSMMNQQIIDYARENNLRIDIPHNVRIFASDTQKVIDPDIEMTKSNRSFRDRTDGEDIIIAGRSKYRLSETHFSGMHNAMNILSVWLITDAMCISSKRIKGYLTEIMWLPHRLEKIGEKNGIIFVEDSKSTSAQSLEAALGSYGEEKNLLIIVGGSDKWDIFAYLTPKFQKRVKMMACIGATKEQFIAIAQQANIAYISTDSLADVVTWLYQKGEEGDILMLSPGCASYGLFRDYLHRANEFRDAIAKIQ